MRDAADGHQPDLPVQAGASAHDLPILNLAGPVTGLLIQPIISALSDRTWSPRWGRQVPFFLDNTSRLRDLPVSFPVRSTLWMAVLLSWLLDASNNTAMEPCRAFIADKLPRRNSRGLPCRHRLRHHARQPLLFFFQNLIEGATEAGIPIGLSGPSCWRGLLDWLGFGLGPHTPEIPPTEAELKALRENKGSTLGLMKFRDAIIEMPTELRKLGLVLPVPVVRVDVLLAIRHALDGAVQSGARPTRIPKASRRRSAGPG